MYKYETMEILQTFYCNSHFFHSTRSNNFAARMWHLSRMILLNTILATHFDESMLVILY